eukprot:3165798-Pleurochrysis_carterae.AAC.3
MPRSCHHSRWHILPPMSKPMACAPSLHSFVRPACAACQYIKRRVVQTQSMSSQEAKYFASSPDNTPCVESECAHARPISSDGC